MCVFWTKSCCAKLNKHRPKSKDTRACFLSMRPCSAPCMFPFDEAVFSPMHTKTSSSFESFNSMRLFYGLLSSSLKDFHEVFKEKYVLNNFWSSRTKIETVKLIQTRFCSSVSNLTSNDGEMSANMKKEARR